MVGVGGCLGVMLLMVITVVLIKAFMFLCRGSHPGIIICRALGPRIASLRGAAMTAKGMRPESRVLVGPRVSNVVSRMCGRTKRTIEGNRIVTGMGIVPRLKRLGSTRDHIHLTRVGTARTRASFSHIGGLCRSRLVDQRRCRGDRMTIGRTHRRGRATGSGLRVMGRNVAGGDTSFDDAVVHSAVSKLVLSMPMGTKGSIVVDGAFGSKAAVTAMTGVGSLVFHNGVSRARMNHVRRNVPLGLAVKTLRGLAFGTVLRCVSPGKMRAGKTGRFRVGTTVSIPSSMRIHSNCSTGTRVMLRHTGGMLTMPRDAIRFGNSSAFMCVVASSMPRRGFRHARIAAKVDGNVGVRVGGKIATGSGVHNTRGGSGWFVFCRGGLWGRDCLSAHQGEDEFHANARQFFTGLSITTVC